MHALQAVLSKHCVILGVFLSKRIVLDAVVRQQLLNFHAPEV